MRKLYFYMVMLHRDRTPANEEKGYHTLPQAFWIAKMLGLFIWSSGKTVYFANQRLEAAGEEAE